MRALVIATLFVTASAGAALADSAVVGAWKADLGDNVTINMTVDPNGAWSSETEQHSKAVRQMKGTYTQKQSNDHAGVIVFTPTQATAKSGKVQKETDHYELAKDGNELRLTTGGDTMVFEKQSKP
ncbi:MAG TPA: hypothetical protein VGM32_03635 [Rhodopila sp.]